jgi:putative SOS response-associated peptidase YedK
LKRADTGLCAVRNWALPHPQPQRPAEIDPSGTLRLGSVLVRPMCGRFTNRLTWRELVALYRLTVPASPERNLPARYNICPTTTIDTVIERDGMRDLVPMRWGLVPSWWKKKAKETPATFNARAETVAEKPMFRSAFKSRRCLIPASGYYEWQNTPTGKQPYYFSTENGSPLTIAGLWDERCGASRHSG